MFEKILKISIVTAIAMLASLFLGTVITLLSIIGLVVVSYLDLKNDLTNIEKKLNQRTKHGKNPKIR